LVELSINQERKGEKQMEMRNSLDGLKTLLGVPSTEPTKPQSTKDTSTTDAAGLAGDRATLSNAGSEVSQTAADSDVRMDKVAAVRAALTAGAYNVSASAVAEKVVQAMLGTGQSSGN
jgi:flagellar biosynthesis anti-sigma factor FlgM